MKTLPILLLALACAGCETTTFESPPVAEAACDPQLAGTWLSAAENHDPEGEIEVRIDAQCTLQLVSHKDGKEERADPTTLHVGSDGAIRYAWLDVGWLQRVGDRKDDGTPPDADAKPDPDVYPGDVMLFRYAVADRTLELRQVEAKAVAKRIIDDQVRGTVKREAGGDLTVRVLDPVTAEAWRDDTLFERDTPLRFVRKAGGG